MYPLLHAMLGTLAYPFTQKRKLDFVLCMFIGILPDLDYIFPTGWIIAHRNITHTLFPMAVVVGLLTLWLFKSFLMGFLPITLHFWADFFGAGKVAVMPYLWVNWDIIPQQLVVSSVIGALILVFWLYYFYKEEVKQDELG